MSPGPVNKEKGTSLMKEELAASLQERIVDEIRATLEENWASFLEDFNKELIAHDDPEKEFKKSLGFSVKLFSGDPDNIDFEVEANWGKRVKIKNERVSVSTAIRAVQVDAVVE
jgi:hypothetical protein